LSAQQKTAFERETRPERPRRRTQCLRQHRDHRGQGLCCQARASGARMPWAWALGRRPGGRKWSVLRAAESVKLFNAETITW